MDKVIVITGVSSGVGLETAKYFLNNNWIVIGLSRGLKKLLKVSKDINNKNFYICPTDIKNYKSVCKSFKSIGKKYKKIDILVNNASIFKQKPFKKFNVSEINDIIDTNLKGTIYCTLECIKLMKIGRIINIGSVSGIHGIENQSIYSASKFGVNGFSESLNQELIKSGIKVSTISPGGINTPLWNKDNPYSGDVNKLLQPLDIAKMIYYISDLSSNVILKDITMFPDCEWH